jgi:hypothetical protein
LREKWRGDIKKRKVLSNTAQSVSVSTTRNNQLGSGTIEMPLHQNLPSFNKLDHIDLNVIITNCFNLDLRGRDLLSLSQNQQLTDGMDNWPLNLYATKSQDRVLVLIFSVFQKMGYGPAKSYAQNITLMEVDPK